MSLKSLLLSSSGIKNIVSRDENKFHFIFGQHDIEMDNFMAEFISPDVSQLHQADITIDSINFNDYFNDYLSIFSTNQDDILSPDIIQLLQNISKGSPIEVSKEQSFKLQIISILLGNEELFSALNEMYPFDLDKSNIDLYIHQLLIFRNHKGKSKYFEYSQIIDFIAQHFCYIDENELLKYPKSVIYSILTNAKLVIKNEDSLLDFIQQIFGNDHKVHNENDENISIIQFYEIVEFASLSKEKFVEFLANFDVNEMSNLIWTKLCDCFYVTHNDANKKNRQKRYLNGKNQKMIEFAYDKEAGNNLNGIICYLTKQCGGNVNDNDIVLISASSTYDTYFAKNVASFNSKNYYFSQGKGFDWLQYDFKEKKVHPTYYTIRTRYGFGEGGCHLSTWVIEGSNNVLRNDWKILDDRKGVNYLDSSYVLHTFKIEVPLESNEYFRYLRIRITGVNTGNCYNLSLSDLEFFGSILV